MTDIETTLVDGGEGAVKGFVSGGPVGALLGAVTGILPDISSAIFGSNGTAVQQAVTAAVASVSGVASPTASDVAGLTPDQQAQLRVQLAQIAAADKASQRAADLAQQQAMLSDVASARSQTVALAAAHSATAWGAPLISLLVLTTFGFVLYLALTRSLPAGSEGLLNTMLGTLSTMSVAVVSYWVGSSAGSTRKTDLLYQSSPAQPAAAVASK